MIMTKVINSLFVIIAAMVTFAGCAKQEIDAPATPETKTVQFFANSIETKTEFGTPTEGVYPTLWSEGDKVDVSVNFAQKKSSSEVECSDDFKSARFEVDLSGTEVEAPYTFYSVSPVDRLRGISSQYKRFYVEILSAQTPLATSVDKDAQLLFAKSSTTEEMPSSVELTYHHLTAYGKFSLTNLAAESVSSIILEAEFDIAGKWDYFLEDGSFVVRSGNGSKSITLTTSSTTDIWFACAPVDMTGQKMTLTVTTEKGNFVKVLNFPADKERKFEAGKISKFTVDMAGIEVEGSEEPEQPGDSEGTTTATLSSDEIKTKIAASKCSYGTEVTYNDADDGVIWTSTCLTDFAARPWLQMKKDASVYIAISADTDIKEVVVTVTAAQNSSGGVEDITKHSSFTGTLSLNTKKDGTGEDVASGAANNNIVTLTPAGNNKTLYLKTSGGARVWNIDVKKSAGSGETPEPEQPKTLVSIAVSGQTTSYTVGDTFAFDGTVTATYSDGSTAEVEPTSVSTPNMTTEGEQAVTVTYTEGEETKTATYTITVTAAVEPEEPSGPIVATIEQFLDAEDSETVWYQLTGKISNIANTTYGNFDLTDETGTVFVYGLKASKDAENKTFSSLGLKVGDTVTLIGNRDTYVNENNGTEKDEVTNAYYVSHVPAPYLTVSTSDLSVAATATSAEFTVDTNVEWTVSCSTATATKSGNKVTVAFVANETAEAVVHEVVVTSELGTETVTITQAAAEQGGGDEPEQPTTSTASIDFTKLYTSNTTLTGLSFDIGDATLTFGSTGNTKPQYYANGTAVRFYGKNEMTISSSKKIVKIVFTFTTKPTSSNSSFTPGSFDYNTSTWTGETTSILIKNTASSGHWRFSKIEVTYQN